MATYKGIQGYSWQKGAADPTNTIAGQVWYNSTSGKFKIATPLGTYNPDWAVVFENEERVYFVAETKSSTVKADLRRNERLKIECGHRHFNLADDVVFKEVSSLSALISQ